LEIFGPRIKIYWNLDPGFWILELGIYLKAINSCLSHKYIPVDGIETRMILPSVDGSSEGI
jgi:hypothetical protein